MTQRTFDSLPFPVISEPGRVASFIKQVAGNWWYRVEAKNGETR